MRYAEIAIPTPVDQAFNYAVPEGVEPPVGARVVVPFRRRQVIGICINLKDNPPSNLDANEIKKIEEVLDDEPSLAPSLVKLINWMSSYYCTPIGEVCRSALPVRMMRLGLPKTTRPTAPHEIQSSGEGQIELNEHQRKVLGSILPSIDSGEAKTFLLHGITGSGKTEVYFRLFAELAKKGRQGLLLVPEIGLTPQLTGRATARFGNRVAVYHSGLTDAQRHEQWLRMRNGDVDIVIGTRSALFAPLPNLGAIVIDEEHDASYKQDEGFTYNGRDAAVMRAHLERITAILGSATPSLESIANVRSGKYEKLELPSRTGNATLPNVEIVDMRSVRRGELQSFSPKLYDAIDETLKRGEQTLLFVGRRGFSSSVQCEACGDVFSCPNCDISLTAHRDNRSQNDILICHYCDYKIKYPRGCKTCGSPELIPLGYGTERLEAEIADFFPSAKVARLDSDVISKPAKRIKVFEDMKRGKTDILIGTQMVTKGHDFPTITLVGVVAADLSLAIPDFRSAEKTFQLITQVAGRAGRGKTPGRVIIQTRQPKHYSFLAASDHNCASFASKELRHRKQMEYPPYSRLANVRISSTKREIASKSAADVMAVFKRIQKRMKDGERIKILGPAPATIEKLRGRYRWQLLIKAPTPRLLSSLLGAARPALSGILPSKARLSIDVDPVNML